MATHTWQCIGCGEILEQDVKIKTMPRCKSCRPSFMIEHIIVDEEPIVGKRIKEEKQKIEKKEGKNVVTDKV